MDISLHTFSNVGRGTGKTNGDPDLLPHVERSFSLCRAQLRHNSISLLWDATTLLHRIPHLRGLGTRHYKLSATLGHQCPPKLGSYFRHLDLFRAWWAKGESMAEEETKVDEDHSSVRRSGWILLLQTG